jgi:hypothetical protein
MMEHWPQGLQIGFPNAMVSFFFFKSLGGPLQGHKVQHLLGVPASVAYCLLKDFGKSIIIYLMGQTFLAILFKSVPFYNFMMWHDL